MYLVNCLLNNMPLPRWFRLASRRRDWGKEDFSQPYNNHYDGYIVFEAIVTHLNEHVS
jgi:hypothetical protein